MNSESKIIPLSRKHNIYALHDERGNVIGTGTLEVCEVLLFIMSKASEAPGRVAPLRSVNRANVRAAIAI